MCIKQVVKALGTNEMPTFRDCNLTLVLQPSLSGNANAGFIHCIAPSDSFLEQTRSTLKHGIECKANFVSNPTLKKVTRDAMFLRLKEATNVQQEEICDAKQPRSKRHGEAHDMEMSKRSNTSEKENERPRKCIKDEKEHARTKAETLESATGALKESHDEKVTEAADEIERINARLVAFWETPAFGMLKEKVSEAKRGSAHLEGLAQTTSQGVRGVGYIKRQYQDFSMGIGNQKRPYFSYSGAVQSTRWNVDC